MTPDETWMRHGVGNGCLDRRDIGDCGARMDDKRFTRRVDDCAGRHRHDHEIGVGIDTYPIDRADCERRSGGDRIGVATRDQPPTFSECDRNRCTHQAGPDQLSLTAQSRHRTASTVTARR